MDIMMLINEYLIEKALVLIPALLILGFILKNTPLLKNWMIPWFLLLAGIGGALAIAGLSWDNVIQGILAAGTAVFTNQLYRQTSMEENRQ